MPIRILLIEAVDAGSDHKKFESVSEMLGLPMLAAWIRLRRPDDEVRIVDRDVPAALTALRPHVVGISFVTPNFDIAQAHARAAQAAGAKVIAGGPHVTAIPLTLPPEMDVGVIGEGEATLEDLLSEYDRHGLTDLERLGGVPGIVFRGADGRLLVVPRRPHLALDDLPPPARELMPPRRRGIMTSRGCPYRCSFCFQAHLERKVRYASPRRVVSEMVDVASTWKIRHLHVYDDLFTSPKPRFAEICDRLVAESFPSRVSLNCNLRPNLVDRALVRNLQRINVSHVFLGLESGVQEVLSYLKPQAATVEQNEEAIMLLDDAGIITSAGIIVGSPDETREQAFTTLRWLERSRLELFEALLLTPLPGTEVWDDAMARGLVSEEMDWARLDPRNDELRQKEPVIMSRTMTREQVLDVYSRFVAARDEHRKRRSAKVFFKIGRRLAANPRFALRLATSLDAYRTAGHVLRQLAGSRHE